MFFSCFFAIDIILIVIISLILRYLFINKSIKFNLSNLIIDSVLFWIINLMLLIWTWSSCNALFLSKALHNIMGYNLFSILEVDIILLFLITILIKKILFSEIYSNKKTLLKEFGILVLPLLILVFMSNILFFF